MHLNSDGAPIYSAADIRDLYVLMKQYFNFSGDEESRTTQTLHPDWKKVEKLLWEYNVNACEYLWWRWRRMIGTAHYLARNHLLNEEKIQEFLDTFESRQQELWIEWDGYASNFDTTVSSLAEVCGQRSRRDIERFVLADKKTPLSDIFRYHAAIERGYEEVAAAHEAAALWQYRINRSVYNTILNPAIREHLDSLLAKF